MCSKENGVNTLEVLLFVSFLFPFFFSLLEAVPPANLQMTSVGKGGLLTIGRLKATMYWECIMLLAIVCIGEANQNCLGE